MADETFGTEVSKKKSTIENIIEWIPEWTPGVAEMKAAKARIEGKIPKKGRKELMGEYE